MKAKIKTLRSGIIITDIEMPSDPRMSLIAVEGNYTVKDKQIHMINIYECANEEIALEAAHLEGLESLASINTILKATSPIQETYKERGYYLQ